VKRSSSRLGKGLDALLGRAPDAEPDGRRVLAIPIHEVHPNPNQPRSDFDPEALAELVESISRNGVIQPIIVRSTEQGYELIAGERRWRSAAQAGLATIPAIVRDASDNESLELSIIENIQRQDLNPIEEAKAYKELIERFALTQDEAASRLGKSRATVANLLRLLDLPPDIQDSVSRGTLSMGHARALLSLPDRGEQRRLAARVQKDDLSVRQTERLVSDRIRRKRPTRSAKGAKPPHIADLESRLRTVLGTRVSIEPRKNEKSGKLVIDYFSQDDFQRILEHLLPVGTPPHSDDQGSPDQATTD